MPTIDLPKRLSHSRLWDLNLSYYELAGSKAWSEQVVPTQITSNPMIADAYAEVIAGYLRDVATASHGAEAPTVTIVELGAGSGQFSFLLVNALRTAIRKLEPHARLAPCRYVMTDIAESNVEGWREHHQLAGLFEDSFVDAAVLDARAPADCRSVISGDLLRERFQAGPVILIANYLFDSLICDAFRVEAGQLFEVQVGLELNRTDIAIEAGPELFEAIRFTQQPVPVDAAAYYPEGDFNAVLSSYLNDLDAGNFLFPVDALRLLRAMEDLAPQGVLVVSADKGITNIRDYRNKSSLGVIETGAFSSLVNFEAIGRWVSGRGGHAKLPVSGISRLEIVAYTLGAIGEFGETELAYRHHIDTIGPQHLHWLVNAVMKNRPAMNRRELLSLLAASHYDPEVLVALGDVYHEAFQQGSAEERAKLAQALVRCTNNSFSFAPSNHANWYIGRLFQALGLHQRALDCFAAALAPAGELAFQQAMSSAALGDAVKAQAFLQEALPSTTNQSGNVTQCGSRSAIRA